MASIQETEAAATIRVPIVPDRTAETPIEGTVLLGGSAISTGPGTMDYELVGGASVTIPAQTLGLDLVVIPADDGIPGC